MISHILEKKIGHIPCGREEEGGIGGFSVFLTKNYNLQIILIPVWGSFYYLKNATFHFVP